MSASLGDLVMSTHVPKIAGLDITARNHVARGDEFGGDFYDVIVDGTGCALVVGDCCGKGASAAPLAGIVRSTLRTECEGEGTPAHALTGLNETLVRAANAPESYCTVALASVQPRGGGFDLRVALAGHPQPLLIGADGRVQQVGRPAPAVGWSAKSVYYDAAVRLGSGDLLLMFTDGLVELLAGRGSTDDSAISSLMAPHAGSSASEIARLLDDILLEAGELPDDAAFLVLRCR